LSNGKKKVGQEMIHSFGDLEMKNNFPTFRGKAPFVILGDNEQPYLLRWFLIPKNKIFNIYLHKFCQSDSDRALHDHPWLFNASFLLRGEYIEHTFKDPKNWKTNGEIIQTLRREGAFKFRFGRAPHRVQLLKVSPGNASGAEKPVWTIFITGPRLWNWGFYCPQGWKIWTHFVSKFKGGNGIGKGCGE